MANIYRVDMKDVIARAAKESGIREDESYKAEIISITDGLCEMVLTTEWNIIDCYADLRTGEILGIMGESIAA